MTDQRYHKLREILDTFSFGFPATPSGVEIDILRKLYTPDEVEVALNLTPLAASLEVIAARMNRDPAELADVLAEMVRKGTVFNSRSPEGEACFAMAPYMIGFAENSAGSGDAELARMFEQHEDDGYRDHFAKLPLKSFIRFVPVGETLDSSWAVAPYNQAEELLRTRQSIAAIPCFCRDKTRHLGTNCDKPIEDACFIFDWLADYSVERGHARLLSVEEAIELHRGFEAAGLVNMPSNLLNPLALCHCCGDCCLPFRAIKQLPNPAESVASDFFMTVDSDECNGCEACIERCPMDALAMVDDPVGTVGVDRRLCIGCGVCVAACTVDAMKLQEKSAQEKSRKPIEIMEAVDIMTKYRAGQAV